VYHPRPLAHRCQAGQGLCCAHSPTHIVQMDMFLVQNYDCIVGTSGRLDKGNVMSNIYTRISKLVNSRNCILE
jgi:hypothetical protein